MSGYVQSRHVHRVHVATRSLGALPIENIVDFFLDFRQLGLLVRFPDSARQGIKGFKRRFLGLWRPDPEKLPRRRQDGSEATQYHRRQIDRVAPLIQKLCWVPL